jgi:hypothetical protein
VMEVVGLGFTIWFTSRYLIFKVITCVPLIGMKPDARSDIDGCQ